MAELHDALKHLAGVVWDEVPQDHLEQYLNDCFIAGELICNSVPPQPNGTPFAESKPHHDKPNSATSHRDVHASDARPFPPHSDHESLSKHWGKPIKFKPADNPLQVSVYKMAGNDRHGAWFARRSIHEGLGFDKWRRAFLREFAESMAVTGGPGAGAVRGLGADRRLERIDVPGTGKLEVYQLSAQFPGPVTPRDFMAMLLVTEDALTDKSAQGGEHVPRHYMVVSKPIEHPDAPIRTGYVRGHYESVEMIREIPLSRVNAKAKAKSTSDLVGTHSIETHLPEDGETNSNSGVEISNHVADDNDNHELNPVEWTMITRSDPGGGIPRFLVERGTPETMIADVHKFFDWACNLDQIPDPDEDLDIQQANSEDNSNVQRQSDEVSTCTETSSTEKAQQQIPNINIDQESTEDDRSNQSAQHRGGIVSSFTNAIGAGFESYAPTSISNLVQSKLNPPQGQESSDDSSDTSSLMSFMSAEELRRLSTAPEGPEEPEEPEEPKKQLVDSVDSLSIASGVVSPPSKDLKDLSHHEREIVRLTKKREKLDQQLAKRRMAEETKLKQSQEKEELDANKQKAETERKLRKTEEKHRKEIEKLEARKLKEARKVEEKRRKKDDQYKMSLVTRERDEFRSQSDMYRRENELLREQVADLQAQSTLLAQKLSQFGGSSALKVVQDQLGHKRSKSLKSIGSSVSSESVPKISDRKPTDGTASETGG